MSWFFADELLIYAETKWKDLKSGNVIMDEKNYFINNQLIAWINSENKLVDNTSAEFKDLDKRMRIYAVELNERSTQ